MFINDRGFAFCAYHMRFTAMARDFKTAIWATHRPFCVSKFQCMASCGCASNLARLLTPDSIMPMATPPPRIRNAGMTRNKTIVLPAIFFLAGASSSPSVVVSSSAMGIPALNLYPAKSAQFVNDWWRWAESADLFAEKMS